MKKSQFSEKEIVAVLSEWTAGAKVTDLIRRSEPAATQCCRPKNRPSRPK